MSCLPYYFGWFLFMQLVDYPALAVGFLVLLAIQRYLPDPLVWLRTINAVRALRQQVEANTSNITARRDLARIYVERGFPRKALALLAEARKRAPEQADLLFLTGAAHLRAGDAEAALEPLGEAVHLDPRIAFGEPYRLAGNALRQLRRYDQAEDAFDHYLDHNSSSLEAWYRIYQARSNQGRAAEARAALEELFSTWRALPDAHRRRQWTWWMRALPSRLLA